MAAKYGVVVVGLGAMGSAAAYALAGQRRLIYRRTKNLRAVQSQT